MSNLEKSDYNNLKIVLLTEQKVVETLWIPLDTTESIFFNNINSFHIEKMEDSWNIFCSEPAYVYIPKFPHLYIVPLEDNSLYTVIDGENKYVILVEYMDREQSLFQNYYIENNSRIWIGKDYTNDIVFLNPYVTRQHALLEKNIDGWKITDNNSANRVYVNGKAVTEAKLHLGDVIFIVGLQIIIGVDFIAINKGKHDVDIKFRKFNESMTLIDQEGRFSPAKNIVKDHIIFSRQPRQRSVLEDKTIQIEGPPVSISMNSFPLLLRMGGSAVMGTSALLHGNPFMMISSVLMPFLNHKYTDKEKKQYEALRHEKYTEYLEDKKNDILNEVNLEEKFFKAMYPGIKDLMEYSRGNQMLWCRRPIDDDFLKIKLGTGDMEMQAKVEYPLQKFCLNEDDLEDEMRLLAEEPRVLKNVPITISLMEHYIINIKGTQKHIDSFLVQFILQIVVLHSYDEVKLVFLTDDDTLGKMEWIRSLPHVWDDQQTIRFIATNLSEACFITEYLDNQVSKDIEQPNVKLNEVIKKRPYYIIVATDKKIIDSLEFMTKIMQSDHNCGMSVIAAYDIPPKDSTLQIDVTEDEGIIRFLGKTIHKNVKFLMEDYDRGLIPQTMKNLANIKLKEFSKEFLLPQSLSFLDMYEVEHIEQLQMEKRWRENNPVKSLAAPIGIGVDGNVICLDMHEKFHGPHGLVAGTTGSGKSQFLLTYILSMVINYHPDEVAFILIDYKGGDLTNAFVDKRRGIHIPHIVGTLTNLDKAEVKHSMLSLSSELLRRERIFNEAKSAVNEATMDIYAYQQLYRQGKVDKPLPHLFIIVDEFAELKLKQKEFMNELISISRIGRSLGVHLILATQKPAGIVDDQIRSNSKAKVCLKVQDKADSMDVLKRPEAVEIKTTGRFYMQIGYNESFELGQSGWCGAYYFEHVDLKKQKVQPIEFIDISGQTYYKAHQKVGDENNKSQLVTIVQKINDYAKEKNIQPRKIWEPPLKECIDLDKFAPQNYTDKKLDYKIPIGRVDDPENQRQMDFEIDLLKMRNIAVVGQPNMGKTTFVQSLLYQVSEYYTPEQIQFYIMEFMGNRLSPFSIIPHCGTVIKDEDKIEGLYNLLDHTIEDRKNKFEELGLDSYEAVNEIEPMPMIFLAIDSLSGFASMENGREHINKIKYYLKNGPMFGIKLIIVCADLKQYRQISEEVDLQICFKLKDTFDYAAVFSEICKNEPSDIPGRGVSLIDNRILQFQLAAVAASMENAKQVHCFKERMTCIKERYRNFKRAKRLKNDDLDLTFEQFCNEFPTKCLPLGYNASNKKAVSLCLKQWKMLCAYLGSEESRKIFWDNLLYIVDKYQMETVVIKSISHTSYFDSIHQNVLPKNVVYKNLDDETIQDLLIQLQQRQKNRNRFMEGRGLSDEFEGDRNETYHFIEEYTTPVVYILEDLLETQISSGETVLKTLDIIMNQINVLLNIHFIAGIYPEQQIEFPILNLEDVTSDEMMILFCGGALDRQKILDFSGDLLQQDISDSEWIMRYRKNNYLLQIPSQLPQEKEVEIDSDDLSIF